MAERVAVIPNSQTDSIHENAVYSQKVESKRPNVFISHRGNDKHLAEKLANELEEAGFEIWLDTWNINVGDSIIARINSGLEDAKFVIVCYSEEGVLSPWMSVEWMSTLSRQLNGYGVKILPIRLSGGSPPAIMADIKYADLVKDWEKGVKVLLKSMRQKK